VKNFTERRKDGPKVRGAFENFAAGEAAKGGRQVVPREEGFCPAFGDRGSGPELIVYIIGPFFFCLGEQRGYTVAFPTPACILFPHWNCSLRESRCALRAHGRGGTFAVLQG
jgi:hypothetical protein